MILLYGPSGSGKTKIIEELKSKGYKVSIGYTTRRPRKGEINGVHYHFISKDDFRQKILDGNFFLEWALVGEELYGTAIADTGEDIIKAVEPNGLKQLMSMCEVVAVYINTPTSIRQERMVARGDGEDCIASRNLIDEVLFAEEVKNLAHIIFDNDREFTQHKVDRLHEAIQVAQVILQSHDAVPKIRI